MKRIFKAPENITEIDSLTKTIFLAGSIEMGKAIQWQKLFEEELSDKYILFNPRRDDWNSTWEQTIDNAEFKEQVNWELNALEKANIIVVYLANNTMSPISLLELGLFAKTGKIKLVVENEFWRKGNIDIVCEKYNIEKYRSLNELINTLNKAII